ncbi:MAG TPA: hypothetical protein VFX59_22850 [Polyangiales bacterium]|nr:hypothetical protein [Polyangiales bacterium]
MLRRVALWSSFGAVTLLTLSAFQPNLAMGQDAGTPNASTGAGTTKVFGASTPTVGVSASTDAGITTTSTPAVTAAPAATTNTAEKAADVDAATYAVRLRDLEQRINELKEQIFRSKARLSLLAETVLQGVVAGSQTVIVHENKMSGSYKLVKVVYALDGAPILNRADEEGGLSDKTEFDVYNGSIVPGEHTLTVNLEYRGHGYGIFSYLKGYRFKVRSSYSFSAPEGKAVNVRVVGYEKGGPTAPLEERPGIMFQEKITDTKAPAAVAEAEGAK